jgi:aspartate carbamoyltransferase catalytic subunit
MALSAPHLTGIRGLSLADIELILQTAEQFKEVLQRPIKKVPALRDYTIANLFFENSTRTRLSFELAQKRLSADTITFAAASSSVKKGETLLDTVRNILAMKVDMIVIRHEHSGVPHWLSARIKARIINAGDGIQEHPTQALLDAYTLKERFGALKGLRVAIVGDIDHSRVAKSNLDLLVRLGAEVRVYGPSVFMPRGLEAAFGVPKPSAKVEEALAWADAVMVLRIQLERMNMTYFAPHEYQALYGVHRARYEASPNKPVILHPGPINRGVELSSDMADLEGQSLILDQVENGVAVRMAIMYLLGSKGALEAPAPMY